ncbi:MAG: hypothetical protein PHG66_04555 [Candidatus Colwellbacteria bacterium]|nr:hypothetical protein [Candidatus Colwellbacteria bacterium]
MKRLLCIVMFIVVSAIVYLLIPSPNIPEKLEPGAFEDPMTKSFRDEIKRWTDRANNETNILKSTIYRSYAMSNLYFLQPFISSAEYRSLSLKIGDVLDPRVPRYINPDIVLSIVGH